jgi:hypothetical protein
VEKPSDNINSHLFLMNQNKKGLNYTVEFFIGVAIVITCRMEAPAAGGPGPPTNTILCLYCRATIYFPGLPANRSAILEIRQFKNPPFLKIRHF